MSQFPGFGSGCWSPQGLPSPADFLLSVLWLRSARLVFTQAVGIGLIKCRLSPLVVYSADWKRWDGNEYFRSEAATFSCDKGGGSHLGMNKAVVFVDKNAILFKCNEKKGKAM